MLKKLSRSVGKRGKRGKQEDEDEDEAPAVQEAPESSDEEGDEAGEEEEDDEDDGDDDAPTTAAAKGSKVAAAASSASAYPTVIRRSTHKKKKVLVLCSRGVTAHFMELMEDVMKLLPHCRKDPKFDKKEPLTSITEIAELGGCKLALYFETRKMKDLYLWAGRVDTGPSVKFLVQQVRPMRDLRLTGNCLLGSRPILSFDQAFEGAPHLALMKHVLSDVFAPPKGHPRSKPFHDHVLSFSLLEGRILIRHYQLVPSEEAERRRKLANAQGASAAGGRRRREGRGRRRRRLPRRDRPALRPRPHPYPRGLLPRRHLYSSETFVSPNVKRAEEKKKRARSTVGAVAQKEKRRKAIREGADARPDDELADVFDS